MAAIIATFSTFMPKHDFGNLGKLDTIFSEAFKDFTYNGEKISCYSQIKTVGRGGDGAFTPLFQFFFDFNFKEMIVSGIVGLLIGEFYTILQERVYSKLNKEEQSAVNYTNYIFRFINDMNVYIYSYNNNLNKNQASADILSSIAQNFSLINEEIKKAQLYNLQGKITGIYLPMVFHRECEPRDENELPLKEYGIINQFTLTPYLESQNKQSLQIDDYLKFWGIEIDNMGSISFLYDVRQKIVFNGNEISLALPTSYMLHFEDFYSL